MAPTELRHAGTASKPHHTGEILVVDIDQSGDYSKKMQPNTPAKINQMDKITLSDRIKLYEKNWAMKAIPLLPIIARLDGRAFHTWTKGLDRPFDSKFMEMMQITTKRLVQETCAVIGYTQSDEITLIFYSDDIESQIFFDGKLQKMNSVLASMCTAYFNIEVQKTVKADMNERAQLFFHKPPATFDCRVFQVPSLTEAVNCLIWRELDATRNSILAVAQSKFSHQEMQGKQTPELQEMLFQKYGINWNHYSPQEKRGSYFRRVKRKRPFIAEEIEQLPPKHYARKNPNMTIERTDVEMVVFPKLTSIPNRVECIFEGAEPLPPAFEF
jgi:tRNA(His) 5'-end guanylyltransferase